MIYKILPDKVEEVIAINKIRKEVMKQTEGCEDVFLLKMPYFDNVFLRCVVWNSKSRAIEYAGKRQIRERFQKFLNEHVEDFGILFLDFIDLDENIKINENLLKIYGQNIEKNQEGK